MQGAPAGSNDGASGPETPVPDPAAAFDRTDPGRFAERPDVTTGTVRTNDVETYYVRHGEGPTVVFVHAMAMNATEWEPQMAALADEYSTVAYDVRGHGHTGGSDRDAYSMELYASDLDALLAALEVERAILVGLSAGGAIAQVYAATYPGRVAGLVLSDTFTTAPMALRGRLLFANLRLMGRLDRLVRYTTLNRIQLWVGNRLAPGVAGDPARIQAVLEAGPTISHAEFRKIADAVADFPRSDFEPSRISVPTLIMYGEHAPRILRDVHVRLADQLANADVELTVVPHAGHASNIDNPAFFTHAVRTFARAVLPGEE